MQTEGHPIVARMHVAILGACDGTMEKDRRTYFCDSRRILLCLYTVPAAGLGGVTMANEIQWTNKSVLAFAGGRDPLHQMEERAKAAALLAMDQGWQGPPFDPISLAKILKLPIAPRADIPDARTVPIGSGISIEFNPLRPRGRVRFSIAHEIAHSFFPDCAEQVRNRGSSHSSTPDEWQLEVLCNIGAAELLMPTGSFPELAKANLEIHGLIELRKKFDVSTEALFIRAVKLTAEPYAAFCASLDDDRSLYRLDYVIPSRAWRLPIKAGMTIPAKTVLLEANAIGFTAVDDEEWNGTTLRVQCIALAPYPGKVVPRVVGLLNPPNPKAQIQPDIQLVTGDALAPRGDGKKILAHVVPDSTVKWGGNGFAAQLRKRYPEVHDDYKAQVDAADGDLVVGQVYKGKISRDLYVFHMVAQRGHGAAPAIRLRYSSLAACLGELGKWAREMKASVHMPKIGTGYAGGDWNVIRELILEEVVRKGTDVTVYQLP